MLLCGWLALTVSVLRPVRWALLLGAFVSPIVLPEANRSAG